MSMTASPESLTGQPGGSARLRPSELSRDRFAALMEVSRLLNSTLQLDGLLSLVMDKAIETVGAERGFLMLTESETTELDFAVARNLDRRTLDSSEFEISRGIVQQVAHTGQPVLTLNAREDPRFRSQESIIGYSLRSILCVPLLLRTQVTGVIYVDNRIRSGAFTPEDLEFLVSFADLAAIAIDNARMFGSLQKTLHETSRLKGLLADVFASVSNGVITLDNRGQVMLINAAAGHILGVSPELALGRLLQEALPYLLVSDLPAALREVISRRREVASISVSPHVPGRGLVHLRLTITRLKGESAGSLVIAIEDETRQMHLEQDREREMQAKNTLRQMLHRYLSPVVVQRLLNAPDELKLGGERQEITILFADLRGFSALASQETPENLVQILNHHLGLAARAVFREEGTLDKFMGDAVMAIFNAPLRQEDHVEKALRTALAIREGIRREKEGHNAAFRLEFGIGVALGEAVVGNIGAVERMDYTAVGECVNLARRLQEVALPSQILISPSVHARLGGRLAVRPVTWDDPATCAQIPTPVYELLTLRSHRDA